METQKAFLSYSRGDSTFVMKLATDLRAAGAHIWVDQLDIPTGKRWDLAIEDALKNAKQVIVILSASSVGSNNVMDEVSYALEAGKTIIPVKLNECAVPFRLKRLQFIDLSTDYNKGLAKLLADLQDQPPAVAKVLDDPGAPLVAAGKDQGRFRLDGRIVRWGALAIAALAIPVLLYQLYLFQPFATSRLQTSPDATLKEVRVWRVGSPYTADVPDTAVPFDLQKEAKTIGVKLVVESFAAKGFAEKFVAAVDRHEEPEILAINNYGIIDGADTPSGHVVGLGSSKQIRNSLLTVSTSLNDFDGRGWQFLVSTARNYLAAKSLALRQPSCDPASQKNLEQVNKADEQELRKRALTFALDRYNVKFGSEFSVLPCNYWGNGRLAFLASIVTSESETWLGWSNLLIIMEKKASSWELVSMGGNPNVVTQLNQAVKLDNGPADALQNDLKIVGPSDGTQSTRFPPPSLQWTWQGDLKSIAIYLLESQAASGNDWFPSAYAPVQAQKDVKMIAAFGLGAQPHRWRVWAIGRNGSAIRSDWSTIVFTN